MNNHNNSNNTVRENENDFKPFNSIDMEKFIAKLKDEDKTYLILMKTFKWIYLALTGLYALFYIVFPFRDATSSLRLSDLLFIIAFIILFFIFNKYHRLFRKVDYSVPLSEMLQNVINRYQLSVASFLEASIPLVLIDLSITLTMYNDLSWMNPLIRVIVIQAFLIPLFVGAGIAGYIIWKKKHKPLVVNAKQMLSDLNAV
jgi:hypothetical protein